jgi:hypothetical protein
MKNQDGAPDPEKPAEDQETPPQAPPAGEDPAAEALKILKEIQGNSEKKPAVAAPAAQSYSEVREKIKTETGWSDAQVDFHMRSINAAGASGRKAEAFLDLDERFKDFKDFKKAINKELETYPAETHGDPVLLEKIYWMEKGKKSAAQPATPSRPNAPERRIVAGYPGFDAGVDGGARTPSAGPLVGEEKELARRMGIPEEKWNKSKSSRNIRELA